MPGEPSRRRLIPSWRDCLRSAPCIVLVAVALACVGCGNEDSGTINRPAIQRIVKAVVFTPSPTVLTPVLTGRPTPATTAPTPVPTPAPPAPAVLPQTPVPAPLPPAPVHVPPPQPPASTHNALSSSVLSQINQRRLASGLNALAPNQALINAAQGYAELSFANGPYQLSHTLDGLPADRAARQGYSGGVGEVLATGEPSAEVMMEVWMASPPHETVIMGTPYSDIGVGCHVAPYTGADGVTWETALCVGMLGVPY